MQGGYSDATCVNVDDVVPTYVVALPTDPRESCPNYIGYKVHRQTNGFGVVPMRLATRENSLCLWNGLIGYWKMEEGTSGSMVADYSASGVNGTPNGNAGVLPQPSTQAPSLLTGVDERSLNFNVLSGQYVTFGNTNMDYPSFTVALWAKAATNNPSDPLYPIHVTNMVGKGDWNVGNNWYIGFYSSGNSAATGISFVYGIGWSIGPRAALSSVDISQWHHYAGVATSTQQTLYIDGSPVSTVNISHGSVTNALELQIARSSYASRYFSGNIDDVRLYNRALSSDEIKALATGSID